MGRGHGGCRGEQFTPPRGLGVSPGGVEPPGQMLHSSGGGTFSAVKEEGAAQGWTLTQLHTPRMAWSQPCPAPWSSGGLCPQAAPRRPRRSSCWASIPSDAQWLDLKHALLSSLCCSPPLTPGHHGSDPKAAGNQPTQAPPSPAGPPVTSPHK